MKGFIEVTAGKRKVLISVDQIKTVYEIRNSKTDITFIVHSFFGVEVVRCEETYEEVRARIAKAVAE